MSSCQQLEGRRNMLAAHIRREGFYSSVHRKAVHSNASTRWDRVLVGISLDVLDLENF